MTGRVVLIAMLLFAVIAGGGLYYAQVYAFYGDAVTEETAMIPLFAADETGMRDLQVTDMTWVQKTSSPLGYRACFTVSNSIAMLTETYALAEEAVPLEAPGWFDCFDADAIGAALEEGSALAFRGEHEVQDGVDMVIAVFDDGRGYAWHQLNDKYKDQ